MAWLDVTRPHACIRARPHIAATQMLRNTLCGAPNIMAHVVLLAVGLGNDTQQ